MPFINPAIEKSSSGILPRVPRYTYVLNNPLKYADPSGFVFVPRDYEGEYMYMFIQRISSRVMEHSYNYTSNGGGGFNTSSGLYYDGVGNFYENGGWVPTSYVVDWYLKPNADFSTSDPSMIAMVYAQNSNSDNYRFTLYTGQDPYGSGHLLIEDLEKNTAKVKNVPFWELTGSYFNELYYFDGLVAYNLNSAVQYAANGGGYHYGNLGQFSTWLESAGFAVSNEIQSSIKLDRLVRAANSLSLWEVTAEDAIKYVKPGSKWIGFLGPAGDFSNLGFITTDWMINGFTPEHIADYGIGIIGFIPIFGDGIAFMYMVTPGMDRMLKEDPAYFNRYNQIVNDFKCFVGGSQVTMADGTFKNIESVQVGYSVLTYNFENQELEINPVLHIDSPVHYQLVRIVFSNGEEIVSTEDHPYYVKGKGWCSFNPQQTHKNYNIQTGQLEVSDYCLTHKRNKLKKVKILQIKPREESVRTYNLTKIENSDNYFVNGILVNTESNTEQ